MVTSTTFGCGTAKIAKKVIKLAEEEVVRQGIQGMLTIERTDARITISNNFNTDEVLLRRIQYFSYGARSAIERFRK